MQLYNKLEMEMIAGAATRMKEELKEGMKRVKIEEDCYFEFSEVGSGPDE